MTDNLDFLGEGATVHRDVTGPDGTRLIYFSRADLPAGRRALVAVWADDSGVERRAAVQYPDTGSEESAAQMVMACRYGFR